MIKSSVPNILNANQGWAILGFRISAGIDCRVTLVTKGIQHAPNIHVSAALIFNVYLIIRGEAASRPSPPLL